MLIEWKLSLTVVDILLRSGRTKVWEWSGMEEAVKRTSLKSGMLESRTQGWVKEISLRGCAKEIGTGTWRNFSIECGEERVYLYRGKGDNRELKT